MKKINVLVIGQTPPPYHGQAIMIEKLVQAKFDSLDIIHLRMAFSRTTEEIGKFNWRKIVHLFRLLLRGTFLLLFQRIDVLYYPPGSPMRAPVLRDMFLLPVWRLLAPKVVYHFHAGGLSEFLTAKSFLFRTIARLAYGKPDASIILSKLNTVDNEFWRARRVHVVPNGLEDWGGQQNIGSKRKCVSLLYTGTLNEEKGIFVLLDAFHRLCKEGCDLLLHLAGEFDGPETRNDFIRKMAEYEVEDKVKIHGLLFDEKKLELYREADVFCFPSYYRAEMLPTSILEAMMCELPVVATKWRGIPDLVVDGDTGFLVPIRDPLATGEKLRLLVQNSDMRKQFGLRGRDRFLREFTLEKHLSRLEHAILETAGS